MSCRIAFVGGTGPEGLGLAMRFAKAGHMVYIGSRSEERAQEAIEKVKEKVPEGDVFGGFNAEGAEKADFVFVTVPWEAHAATLQDLAEAIGDKILVDVVVPMTFDKETASASGLPVHALDIMFVSLTAVAVVVSSAWTVRPPCVRVEVSLSEVWSTVVVVAETASRS